MKANLKLEERKLKGLKPGGKIDAKFDVNDDLASVPALKVVDALELKQP